MWFLGEITENVHFSVSYFFFKEIIVIRKFATDVDSFFLLGEIVLDFPKWTENIVSFVKFLKVLGS